MTACPFFYVIHADSIPTNGSGKAETQNALKIAPKTGFFYCLDILHEKRRNAPKNRQRNAKNGKQGNGATVEEYATAKTKPLNRPKTNENLPADQIPNRNQNEPRKGKNTLKRETAKAPPRFTPHHEKRDSRSRPKKEVYAYQSPQSETLTGLGGMPYQVYSARVSVCPYAVIQ